MPPAVKAIPVDFRGDSDLLRTLIDHLPDCFIYVKDAQSRFIFTNVAHLKLLGVDSVEEVVGRTDFDFFPKELAEQYYADEQKVITSGKPVLYPELPVFWNLMRTIGRVCPKVETNPLAFPAAD